MDTILTIESTPFRVRTNRTGRHTYARDYKLEVAEQCIAPGASLAAVALSHGINANVVRKWVVQHRAGLLARKKQLMLPVSIEATGQTVTRPTVSAHSQQVNAGVIEIELESSRIRVRGNVDAQALRTVLETLTKR